MIRKQLILLALLLVCQGFVMAQTDIKAKMDALMQEELLKTSEVGIAVYDLTAGKPLYTYQDKKLYRPASIEKLITAITALSYFDGNHPFETKVCYTGSVEAGELNGDLYVIGGFDSEFDDNSMESLLAMVEQSGIKKVNGQIYGDVSAKDSLYWGPGWSWDDNPYYFQPYLSPLMFNKGYVNIIASPSARDSVANVTCNPRSSFYTLVNKTVSRNPSAGKFEATRNWLENGNELTVGGNVSSVQTDRINVYTSQDFFMHTFVHRLSERVEVIPVYAFARCADSTAVSIGTYSHSMKDVLERALKKSDNLSAEAIFFQLARAYSGKEKISHEDGSKAVYSFIKRLGFTPDDYNIVDGSGVSLYNYISPELLLAYLKYAYSNKKIYEELCSALPIAGVDGTLRGRMKQGNTYQNIRAKTGSVKGVSSLAGYAKAANGHDLAFVIINQNIMKGSKAHAFQDKVCEVLCRYK